MAAAAASALAPSPGTATETVEIRAARPLERAGTVSLSGAELAGVPGSGGDPLRALQSLPGVAALDDASSEPAVRGARPGDNAYLVDFLPVGYLFHAGGLVSVFNPDLIQRFEMHSAAWSPEYPDVIGAVFDVSLRTPRSDRLGAKLEASLLSANALFEGPLAERVSFFFAARRSYFDLFVKSVEDAEEGVRYSVPVYGDRQGRLLWTPTPSQRLRLDFTTADDRTDFTVNPNSKIAQREPVLVGNSNERTSFANVAAVWEAAFAEGLSNKLALGRLEERSSARLAAAGTVSVRTIGHYLREQLIFDVGAHALTFGGSVQSTRYDVDLDFLEPRCTEFDPNCDLTGAPRVRTRQKVRQNLADLYVNDRWQLTRRWAVTGGLRTGHDSYLRRTATDPRLGIEWAWAEDTVLSAGIGRHRQMPEGGQILAGLGNPRLDYLAARHAVIGIAQKLDGGWSWRAEAYGKRFERFVVSDPLLNYRNGAGGGARGAELLVKRDAPTEALGVLTGFVSVSASRATRRVNATGERFPFDYDQPLIVNAVVQYRHSGRWSCGLKWTYHTGSPFTPVVGAGLYADGRVRPIYGAVNSQRLSAYHRLDLRADARFSPALSAYFEIVNAYNRKNVAGFSYSADYRTREEVYQLPVLPSVGIQYRF
jgi:hypothetical protein